MAAGGEGLGRENKLSRRMPKVVELCCFPVKGFTPEPVEHITVLPGGRVAGDRVLNFRFADAPASDTGWCRKYHGVVLANTPGLARLKVISRAPSNNLNTQSA